MSNTKIPMLDIPGAYERDGDHGIGVLRFFESSEAITSVVPHKLNESDARSIFTGPRSNAEWAGGLGTLADWKAMSEKGWTAGLSKLHKNLKTLQPSRAKSIRRKPVWKDDGDDIDMEKVWSGRFEDAWRGFTRRESSGPRILKIWVDATASASRDPEELFWRGAAAVSMVEALEEAGYRCEVWVYEWTSNCHKDTPQSAFAFLAKEANQYADLARLALLTAHPSTLRTMFFAMNYATERRALAGLGAPRRERFPVAAKDDLCINNLWTKEGAQCFLDKEMERFA